MLTSHVYIFFGKVLSSFVQFLIGLFIFLLLSFKNYLCILDNRPLSGVFFTIIFSQSVAYHLISLTFFFFSFSLLDIYM